MKVVDIASIPARRAPFPSGPTVRTVLGADAATGAALLQVTLPAGAGMPEHDHGPSAVVLIALSGQAELRHDGTDHPLRPGRVAQVGVGERVSLHNRHADEAVLLAVVAPPEFTAALAQWPSAEAVASDA